MTATTDPSDYTALGESLDLPAGIQLVATEPLDQLVFGSPIAFANRRIIVLDGPPGTGKTTALQVSSQLNRGRRVVIVTLDESISPRGVLAAIKAAIIGETYPADGPLRYQETITMELRSLFTREDIVLMVDEAQRAPIQALEKIRTLHEHRSLDFGLILSGVNMMKKVAREPMLRSRVGMKVSFERQRDAALTEFLVAMNPLAAALEHDVLLAVDDQVCHGDLRQWAIVFEWLLAVTNNGAVTPTPELLARGLMLSGNKVRLP